MQAFARTFKILMEEKKKEKERVPELKAKGDNMETKRKNSTLRLPEQSIRNHVLRKQYLCHRCATYAPKYVLGVLKNCPVLSLSIDGLNLQVFSYQTNPKMYSTDSSTYFITTLSWGSTLISWRGRKTFPDGYRLALQGVNVRRVNLKR